MGFKRESPLAKVLDTFARAGRLEWIGVRPAPRAALMEVNHVEALADQGLADDHAARRGGGNRQVTLIQAGYLPVVAGLVGHADLRPEWTRRNLVVSGINLAALRDRCFAIGGVLLQGTGRCEPCSRMEANLGSGGLNAMRGHGGITARVLRGGVIRVGGAVEPVSSER